jgi:hypothetical protein
MMAIRVFATILTAVLFVAIGISVATGNISVEGRWILENPWGRMSLLDIYGGVALLAGWVVLREKHPWSVVLWLPLFVVLGHAGTALYASIAAYRSDDIRHFLLGARA